MSDSATTAGTGGTGLMRTIRRFLGDGRGVAAVEFAFIAPLLLSMYFVTMEVAQGIEANKKVSRVGSMVADLVTQQQGMTKTEVESVMKIGEAILQPYNRSKPTLIVTQIEITNEDTPKVKVSWSRKLENGAFSAGYAKESTTTVPNALKVKGTFLIRVESQLGYRPVITWAANDKPVLGLTGAFDNIAMKEVYYLRPRMSQQVKCNDC